MTLVGAKSAVNKRELDADRERAAGNEPDADREPDTDHEPPAAHEPPPAAHQQPPAAQLAPPPPSPPPHPARSLLAPAPLVLAATRVNSRGETVLNSPVLLSALTKSDIVNGRGGLINSLAGNLNFRAVCAGMKDKYFLTPRASQHTVAGDAVAAIVALNPPGRFLELDKDKKAYYPIGDKWALEKSMQVRSG